ncbi:MAG: helix-turn-helix domain-containing protein [Betaproteobacteria bacterium]|nr:helix-turn-helix domain-containing protein [Betaproteobacteria bacterium]
MSKRENLVDHVLDRMVEAVLGENAHFKSHAEALGIPQDTIKTWRRRGAVPAGYLSNFAREWKASVDWLQYGPEGKVVFGGEPEAHQVAGKVTHDGINADERKLLENYRKSPAEVREALQLVASIASRPQAAGEHAVKPPRARVMRGELPHRKFKPPVVVSGEPAQAPARARKKRGDT